MWLAFYVPWAVTIAHPVAGFVTTTVFMAYHYLFHREIVQRIELSVLSNPIKIFEGHYQKNQNGQAHDSEATRCGETKPSQGEAKMEKNELQGESESDAGRPRQDPKEAQQVPQEKVSPYVWDYSTW